MSGIPVVLGREREFRYTVEVGGEHPNVLMPPALLARHQAAVAEYEAVQRELDDIRWENKPGSPYWIHQGVWAE